MPSILDLDMNSWDDALLQTDASIEKRLELESLAEALQQNQDLAAKPLSETDLVIEILMKIPFIASLFHRIKTTGVSVFSLATFKGEVSEVKAPSFLGGKPFLVTVYKNLGLIAAITDFITIPLIFFASMLLKKPYPITLTKLGEWLYSGVLLALMITSIALPATAPIIAGVLCALGLAYSTYLLYQFYEQRKELNRIIPINRLKIEAFEKKIEEVKTHIRELKASIQTASESELEAIEQQLKQYQHSLANDYHELTTLINEGDTLEKELKALNNVVIYDKILGFTLSTLTMIGFAIGLFNPVIGFVMLTSVAVVGSIYALARIALPFFKAIGKSIKNAPLEDKENIEDKPSSKIILTSLTKQNDMAETNEDEIDHTTSATEASEKPHEIMGNRFFSQRKEIQPPHDNDEDKDASLSNAPKTHKK